jgi:hypothetical protein
MQTVKNALFYVFEKKKKNHDYKPKFYDQINQIEITLFTTDSTL